MSETIRIPLLTDDNYKSWLVNVRAILRQKNLWDDIQIPLTSEDPKDAISYQKAADILTPTISETVQNQLTDAEFNNAYLMLERLKKRYAPINEQSFIQAWQELLQLSPSQFSSHENWMTQIKVLNERIDSMNIEFTTDKRTLLVMMIGLAPYEHYRALVQIWASTKDMTGERAMAMLREDLARGELDKENANGAALYLNNPKGKKKEGTCEHCGKPGHEINNCWKKHPELRPEWAGSMQAADINLATSGLAM